MDKTIQGRIRALPPGSVGVVADLAGVSPVIVSRLQKNPRLVTTAQAVGIESALADLEFIVGIARDARESGEAFALNYFKDTKALKELIDLARRTEAERLKGVAAEQGSYEAAEGLLAALPSQNSI